MTRDNVLRFERPDNCIASHRAKEHLLGGWRAMFGQFKEKHSHLMTPSEAITVKNLMSKDDRSSMEQWVKGFAIIARYATPSTARRLLNGVVTPLLDLCAKGDAYLPLPQSAREEFLAGHAADAAQFPVIAHADCSTAHLLNAIKASENHLVSIELHCASMRAELARRGWTVAA